MADLSPKLLEIGRRKITEASVSERVEEPVEGNVCDLSHWDDNYFDAVLCLGPYYHLPNSEDRQKATSEIARVLGSGGLLYAALMPRLGFLRRTLAIPDERHRLRDADFVEQVLDEGVFENDIPGRFTNGYGFVPEGVEVLFAGYGFSKIGLYSAESITIGIQKALHDLAENDSETYTAALDLIVRTADEPSILGMAVHLLYIGRKEKGNPTPVPPDEVEPRR